MNMGHHGLPPPSPPAHAGRSIWRSPTTRVGQLAGQFFAGWILLALGWFGWLFVGTNDSRLVIPILTHYALLVGLGLVIDVLVVKALRRGDRSLLLAPPAILASVTLLIVLAVGWPFILLLSPLVIALYCHKRNEWLTVSWLATWIWGMINLSISAYALQKCWPPEDQEFCDRLDRWYVPMFSAWVVLWAASLFGSAWYLLKRLHNRP